MQVRRQEIRQEVPEEMMMKTGQMRPRDESLTDLIGDLANQSASLVRDEMALAKQELDEKFQSLRSSVIVLATGAFVGFLAALALCAAAIAGLSVYLDVWLSALLVGGLLAVIAGVVISSGLGRLKQANLKPEKTIETLEENREWLKELT